MLVVLTAGSANSVTRIVLVMVMVTVTVMMTILLMTILRIIVRMMMLMMMLMVMLMVMMMMMMMMRRMRMTDSQPSTSLRHSDAMGLESCWVSGGGGGAGFRVCGVGQ